MKVKTSVTLSPAIMMALDALIDPGSNRSRVIERAVEEFIQRRTIEMREARDLEILDREAEELNREVADVLEYQIVP